MVVDNDIPIPGTDQSVNASEPASMLMTLALLAAGAGIGFFAIFDLGGEVRGALGALVSNVTGMDVGDNQSSIEVE